MSFPAPPPPGGQPPGGFGTPPPPGGFGPPPGNFGPPPGGFGPPPAGFGGPPPASNGLATAALVTGLISMLCFPPLTLAAIPLGIAGMSRAKKLNGNGKGMAIAGLVTGIFGLIWCLIFAAVVIFAASEVDSDPSDGVCNPDRVLQDPDCSSSGGINSDPSDGVCNEDRYFEDPDC